jgi:DNA-binding FrmR family transcriptional regulator
MTQERLDGHAHEHEHAHTHGHVQEHAHEQSHGHAHEHTHVMPDGTVVTHSHGHKHAHTHQNTKAVLNRLARAIGHLEKVKKMVEDGEDCSEVLIQLSAVKSAINNTGKLILKQHMEHCIVEAVRENDQEAIDRMNEAIDRFMK